MSTATASPTEKTAMPGTPETGEDTAVTGPYHWTRDEYHKMAEASFFDDKRVELLDGVIWTMPPQLTPHATAIRRTFNRLRAVFGDEYSLSMQLPITISNWSEPEPDVTVARGSVEDFADHHPSPAEVALLVEVSDSTLTKDRTRKARSYALAGIHEYWIVNLVDRQVEVYRDPSPEGAYQSILILGPAKSIAPLNASEMQIQVADLLPPVHNSPSL